MALNPVYNNDFFKVDYAPTVIMGEAPRLAQGCFEAWKSAWDATSGIKAYQNGCLLGLTDKGLLTLYDDSKGKSVAFAGVMFDETQFLTPGPEVFTNYAIKDGEQTLWKYEFLIGVNGKADIDGLIADGRAVKRVVNGAVVVQFGIPGYGKTSKDQLKGGK